MNYDALGPTCCPILAPMQTIMFTHSAHVHFDDKIRFRLFVGCYKHSSARWTLARAFCALGSFCPWIGHKPKQNQTQKIYTPNKTRKWSKIGSGGLALRISLIRACFFITLTFRSMRYLLTNLADNLFSASFLSRWVIRTPKVRANLLW